MRLALDLRNIDLDMHLDADTGVVTTRARIQLRNAGTTPLATIALQVSSQLQWQSARLADRAGDAGLLPATQSRVLTDADHTGAANEVALTLPKPLAPGAELSLDLYYGGTLTASAERLVQLGAPAERAAAADWDSVSSTFIGLRGFGNVLWFPVAAPPTLLTDGDKFAAAADAQRRRTAATTMRLALTLEHTGSSLREAWFLGQPAALVPALARRPLESGSDPGDNDASTLDKASWDGLRLDGRAVSLFVAGAPPVPVHGVAVISANADAVTAYTAAAAPVAGFLSRWLGGQASATLAVLDLPSPGVQPFAEGSLLVMPLRPDSESGSVAASLTYPMTLAALPPGAPAWVREGLPEFLRLTYLETNVGRAAAQTELAAMLPTLRQAEGTRGMDPAPLRTCVDPVCARIKSAFVLRILQGLVGDTVLQQALAEMLTPSQPGTADAANPEADYAYVHRFQAALEQFSKKDLAWFFRDWFNADRGLPALEIVEVAPRRIERGAATVTAPQVKRPVAGPIGAEPEAEPDDPRRTSPTAASRNQPGLPDGSWLVAVEVQNNGDAAAEVPVTVRGSGLQNALPLRIPAHGKATIRVPFETSPEEVLVNNGAVPEQVVDAHRRSIQYSAPR